MKRDWLNWPRRFIRWLFGGPFRKLPPAFGSTVPAELQVFEAQVKDAGHEGIGGVATQAPTPHPKTRPARPDSSLERQ